MRELKNLCSAISTIVVWTVSLALVTGCQAQAKVGSTLAIEATSTPSSPVEAPVLTPSPAPEGQVGVSKANNGYDLFPYVEVGNFGEAGSGKLSGIVFYPKRKTLFAVSDNGRLSEIKTDGTLIQKEEIRKKADFEGVTYSPATEMLYIAVEGEEIILEVDPETLEAKRDIPIDRMFEGQVLLSPDGNGIEGITFVSAGDGATHGSFYLVNQSDELVGSDPSIVFEVEIDHTANEPKARIRRHFSVGVTDLSGIQYTPSGRRLLIISDANNLLLEVSLEGQVLETYEIPGKKQEGITVDENGFLYIAQDRDEALMKFISLDKANGMK